MIPNRTLGEIKTGTEGLNESILTAQVSKHMLDQQREKTIFYKHRRCNEWRQIVVASEFIDRCSQMFSKTSSGLSRFTGMVFYIKTGTLVI